MSALIEVRGLRVARGRKTVLQVESLDLETGEVLALVGPNGAGKTTFLLALASLLKPAKGEVRFGGRALGEWNALEYRRRISFVFQSPLLLDMDVAGNVALGLRFRGLPKDEIRSRVDRWLRQLGIESLAARRAGELSGGEAQRVSLARALVLDPELLLLDEPFPGLDASARVKLYEDLAVLLAANHGTAVLVTHSLKEAARLGDRVAVIVAGQLRQVGSAREIKARPVDEEVAAFVRDLRTRDY